MICIQDQHEWAQNILHETVYIELLQTLNRDSDGKLGRICDARVVEVDMVRRIS